MGSFIDTFVGEEVDCVLDLTFFAECSSSSLGFPVDGPASDHASDHRSMGGDSLRFLFTFSFVGEREDGPGADAECLDFEGEARAFDWVWVCFANMA